ncbi:MAG: hypothetical protein V4564_08025 [Pseudomonadota bacterium]|uniref:hypothetical protein n=1 Tax=Sphingomonas sp. ERG5 TaxID=1381597 RepID=UPI00068D3C90|nr:hypothetical protein [Sphingomonas sp. ERG5]
MKRLLIVAGLGFSLAGCATTGTPAPARVRPPIVPIPTTTHNVVGLEHVMGQNARGLVALFGRPGADMLEGDARKLQFASGTCVLDAYLYPKGKAEPVVTHVDARQTDGSPVDRASCVAALSMKAQGK